MMQKMAKKRKKLKKIGGKSKTQDNNVTFIGLDLAWSPRNPSGCAVIRNERLVDYCGQLGSDDEIYQYVREHLEKDAPAIIGVDAPIRVPNRTGSRRCDRELSAEWRKFEAGALPANRQLLSRGLPPIVEEASDGSKEATAPKLPVRGELLTQMLVQRLHFGEIVPIPQRAQDRIICEIFPHPAHVSLFGLDKTLKYKARGRRDYESRWAEFERYQRYLRSLRKATPALKGTKQLLVNTDVRTLRGKALKEYEDVLDALSCAYIVSYLWHHGPGSARVYGTLSQGHIIVPITKEMEKRLG